MKSITEQLLDAKLLGEDKAEIQRLQQLLDEEEEAYINEIFDEESDSEFKIKEVTNQLQELLIKKNRAYGNSALEPLNVFSKHNAVDSLCARLDDKLSRIKNKGLNDKTEDTLFDLAGYLILLIIARDDK
jgi:hypothetical protein